MMKASKTAGKTEHTANNHQNHPHCQLPKTKYVKAILPVQWQVIAEYN